MLPSIILEIFSKKRFYGYVCLLLIDIQRILVPERRLAHQEFIYQNAKGPPVNRATMTSVSYNFWGKIFRCSAKSICLSCRLFSVLFKLVGDINLAVLLCTFLANPKSTNFKWPLASIRMFSGFRSLYATPSFSCKYSSMSTISAAYIWDVASLNLRALRR